MVAEARKSQGAGSLGTNMFALASHICCCTGMPRAECIFPRKGKKGCGFMWTGWDWTWRLASENSDPICKTIQIEAAWRWLAPRWSAPSGPYLPRERVTAEPVVGEVVEWKDRIRKLCVAVTAQRPFQACGMSWNKGGIATAGRTLLAGQRRMLPLTTIASSKEAAGSTSTRRPRHGRSFSMAFRSANAKNWCVSPASANNSRPPGMESQMQFWV